MTDTEPKKYQEWILETIDSLRSRKARPDLERICRMVRRRYGSDPDRTRAELEKLIESQTVLKVSYKGSISYRNAAKVLRRSKKMSELAASRGESRGKQEHLNNSAGSAQSSTGQDTEEASLGPGKPELPLDFFNSSACNCETPCCAAPEEQETSALSTKIGFGQQQEGCRQPSHVGDTHSVSSAAEPSGEVQLRAVNFLNNKTCSIISQSQTRSKLCAASSAQGDNRVASVRSLSAASTGHMKPLGRKGTTGCLSPQERLSCEEKLSRSKVKGFADRDVARARLRWTRCGNGTLGAALEPSDVGKQLQKNDPTLTTGEDEKWKEADKQTEQDTPQICDELSEPPVAMTTDPEAEDAEMQESSQRWTRGKLCTESLSATIPEQSCGDPEIDEASCLLTSTASPTDSGLDEPDSFGSLSPIEWSVSDVVSYFSAAGFPEQAAAFRTQEIDGKALLLMQRNDVLTGLSIKLGPALKIYEHHVKALQKTHFDEDEL